MPGPLQRRLTIVFLNRFYTFADGRRAQTGAVDSGGDGAGFDRMGKMRDVAKVAGQFQISES